MTSTGAEPKIGVQLDGHWVEMPVHSDEDPGDWAAALVDGALRARGLLEPEAIVGLYVQSWALLVENLRGRPGSSAGEHLAAAYALVSQEDLLAVSVTELWVFSAAMPLDVVVDGVVVDRGERFGEPVISDIEAPAGSGVRVQQYVVSPGADGSELVQTSVVHVWQGPVPGTTVFLSTWFGSFVDGELYEPVLEALASSLTWQV